MRPTRHALIIALMCAASPAFAQVQPGEKPRSTGEMAKGVVTQPLSDLNVQKKGVPPELAAILDNPYALDGIRRCRDVIRAVRELDAVLGPDFDEPAPVEKQKTRDSAMAIAGGLIGSLIPFRFLIREVSGANKADQAYREAIYAGVVRRGFLKGYGSQRRCKAPGSPARRIVPPPVATDETPE